MNKDIRIKEKKHIKYLDKGKEYCLQLIWSKCKLLVVTVEQRNFIGK
jgi:hypothetical protein